MADERPQPQYGEYAPEGWQWKPAESGPSNSVSGVPHNLGARPSAPAAPTTPAAPESATAGDPPPYRAGDPAPQRASAPPSAPAPQLQPAQSSRLLGDRIVTIAMLALGALGALYFAFLFSSLRSFFSLVTAALEPSSTSLPEWIYTTGRITAFGMLAIYAVALIWSIQRMRAKKLAFWVPLAAGALAFLIGFVVFAVIATGLPAELMQELADPSAQERIIEYLNSTQP